MKTSVRSPLLCQLRTGIFLLWILFSTLTTYGDAQIDRGALTQVMLAYPVDVSLDSTNTDPTASKQSGSSLITANSAGSVASSPVKHISDTIDRLTIQSATYKQPITIYQSRISDRAEIFLSKTPRHFLTFFCNLKIGFGSTDLLGQCARIKP